jgi:hypothetical protein
MSIDGLLSLLGDAPALRCGDCAAADSWVATCDLLGDLELFLGESDFDATFEASALGDFEASFSFAGLRGEADFDGFCGDAVSSGIAGCVFPIRPGPFNFLLRSAEVSFLLARGGGGGGSS